MSLDDIGDAIAGGALEGGAEGLAGSVPLPPYPSEGPAMPPPPGEGHDSGEEPGPEGPPEHRSVVPIVLALLLTALVGLGGFALVSWASGGAACEGDAFRSVRFGYCTETPAGWVAEAAEGEDSSLDRFLLQDGAAAITVTAVPLTRGQDLARFEQFVRAYAEEAGATTGVSSATEVDGVDAIAFDSRLEGPDGVVRSREVVFAREGIAWRVTLASDDVAFDASIRRLDELLGSWRFV